MQTFKGRVVYGGNVEGEALVTHQGFNTLASYLGSRYLRAHGASGLREVD